MDEEHILYNKEDNVGTITLNRPDKLNAVTHKMIHRLRLLIDEIKADEEVKAVILTGVGKAFSAGTDISDDPKPPPEEDIYSIKQMDLTQYRASSWFFNQIPKPVICAFMGGSFIQEGVRYLKEHGIPNYIFPEEAMTTLGGMCRYAEILAVPRRAFREFRVEREAAARFIAEKLENAETSYLSQVEPSSLFASTCER